MDVGFENTCTVSISEIVSMVVPRLYGWVYKILKTIPLLVQLRVPIRGTTIQQGPSQRLYNCGLPIGGPISNPMSSQFSITALWNSCSESVGASKFEILVRDFEISFCYPRRLRASPQAYSKRVWRNLVRVECL